MNVSRQKLLNKLAQWKNDGEWTKFYEMVNNLLPAYNDYAVEVRDEQVYYNNEEWIDEMLRGLTPSEVLGKVYHGKYNGSDPYITFDGYANLKTLTEVEFYELYLTDPDFEKWYVEEE